MKKLNTFFSNKYSDLMFVSIMFLFFLQLFSDFVESVYIFCLMTLSLNENALTVFFFLSSILLLLFVKNGVPRKVLIVVGEIMILARLLEPLFDTQLRMIISGIGLGCFMIFFPAFLSHKDPDEEESQGINLGIGFVIALIFSILFRTLNSSIDITTWMGYQVIGWILGIIETVMLLGFYYANHEANPRPVDVQKEPVDKDENLPEGATNSTPLKDRASILGITLGLSSIIVLVTFVFNGTTVLARFTEGNYIFITSFMIIILGLFAFVAIYKPEQMFEFIKKPGIIWIWNGLFILSLIISIGVNQVYFPLTSDNFPIVVSSTTIFHQIPLVFLILLLPIIFIDFILLLRQLIKSKPPMQKLAGSFTLGGGLYMLLIIFSIIFTTTWGFVKPISLLFRDQLWLLFLINGLVLLLSLFLMKKGGSEIDFKRAYLNFRTKISAITIIGIVCVGTIVGAVIIDAKPIEQAGGATSLKILTYNLQQGVDPFTQKNYDGQLALIREIDADIIGLQETSKIAGNSDVVRYFADKLNMYSYFGPRGVTGTTGVALLSKYPIKNAITFYHFSQDSDKKQTATIEAEITIGTKTFTIYNTHTFGSTTAKSMLINDTLARAEGKDNVISIGDFNFRENSEPYNLTTDVLVDAWLDEWPSGVDDNSVNASSRIDHIFTDPGLNIVDCRYVEWIQVQSDHPACWAEIQW